MTKKPTVVFKYNLQYQIRVNAYFSSIIQQLKNPELRHELSRQYTRQLQSYEKLKFNKGTVAELLKQFFSHWWEGRLGKFHTRHLKIQKKFVRRILKSGNLFTEKYKLKLWPQYKCPVLLQYILSTLRSEKDIVSTRYWSKKAYFQQLLHTYQQFINYKEEVKASRFVTLIYHAVIALRILQLIQSHKHGYYKRTRTNDQSTRISNSKPILLLINLTRFTAERVKKQILTQFTLIMMQEISRKFNVAYKIFTFQPQLQGPRRLPLHLAPRYQEQYDSEQDKEHFIWQQDDLPLLKFKLPQNDDDEADWNDTDSDSESDRSEEDQFAHQDYIDSSSSIKSQIQQQEEEEEDDDFEPDSSSMMEQQMQE